MLQTVEIQYDGTELSLRDESQRDVILDSSASRVQWLVQGAPNDCFPRITFVVDDEQPFVVGPFNALRTNQTYVLSSGIRADAGTFPYQVTLHRQATDESGSPASIAAPLTGLSCTKGTTSASTGVTIVVRPDDQGSLAVEPDLGRINTGDTVTWVFEGMAGLPSWLPQVTFFRVPEGSRQTCSHLGPFTSLTTQEDRVIGAGNNGVLGTFSYLVEVLDFSTQQPLLQKRKDPGMANDGDPPGGVGG